jgi:hypothetical protein
MCSKGSQLHDHPIMAQMAPKGHIPRGYEAHAQLIMVLRVSQRTSLVSAGPSVPVHILPAAGPVPDAQLCKRRTTLAGW